MIQLTIMYKLFGKRLIDIVVSLLMLLLLSPFFVVLAVLVWLNLGPPIFFKQTRPGFLEQPFEMVKFRTMRSTKNNSGQDLPDQERLTKFGTLLRSLSLDELPELFNVLKGDMSLVGPRPLLMEYLSLYNENQRQRHHVKPGITGLAQVNGRNAISWEQKFEYDIEYTNNVSIITDLKILFLTVITVFKQTGITSKNHVSAEPFSGNDYQKD